MSRLKDSPDTKGAGAGDVQPWGRPIVRCRLGEAWIEKNGVGGFCKRFPMETSLARNARVVRANFDWPLSNVWLGVSVEDQKTADVRVPLLLRTPAWVQFVSYEPAIEGVRFDQAWLTPKDLALTLNPTEYDSLGENGRAELALILRKDLAAAGTHNSLDWIICGGESGPGARPMHPDWARSVRDQCTAAGVAFFFKQWDEWMHGSDFRDSARIVLNDGRVIREVEDLSQEERNRWPEFDATMMAPVGKKAAGYLLDGVAHRQMPEVRA